MEINRVLMGLNRERFGMDCLDMADPAAMAAALCPDCIKTCEKYWCEVDVSPGPGYGNVLIDRYGFSGKEPNAWICSELRADRYKEYISGLWECEMRYLYIREIAELLGVSKDTIRIYEEQG